MPFFRYARDFYGNWLAEQLLPSAAMLIVLLAFLFMGLHLLRRSRGEPVSTEAQTPDEFGREPVQRYALGARLYHWGNFVFLFALSVSGIALFAPRSLFTPPLSWLRIHEIFAGLFILGLIVHIVVAGFVSGEPRTMWFERRDWRDLKLIGRNFFGHTRDYPAFGKYDPWQKVYHALLALLSAVMIFTGVFLFLSAEVLATYSHEWMRWQRLMHDLAAFVFIAVIAGHIYFGMIRVNWPALAAMFTGRIAAGYFGLRHSARRWRPIENINLIGKIGRARGQAESKLED
jgi:Ni/Fe-hydrogenase 1 B-type cytochrome subunit